MKRPRTKNRSIGYYIGKIYRFMLANSIGTCTDLLMLWTLSHYVFDQYVGQYMLAPLLSFECAVFVNYLSSRHFVWRDRVSNSRKSHFWRKYLAYNISATGAFTIKMIFLLLFERIFEWQVVVCNIAALCISGSINFTMGEWVIFKKRPSTKA